MLALPEFRREQGLFQRKGLEKVLPGRGSLPLICRNVGAISHKLKQRAADPLVLFYLVRGGAGEVFRFEPAALANLAGIVGHYWNCALYQHGGEWVEQSEFGCVADVPALSDAVLRVEFCRAGERPWVCADFFA